MPNQFYIYGIVLLALSIIIGLFLTISKPIISLNSTLTEILTRMQVVESQINGFSQNNRKSHKTLHARIDHVEGDINDLRLQVHSSNKKTK